jgi:predicted ATPase
MLALHRCGRSADALTIYEAICRALDDQLGVDPGEALTALSKAIYRGDPTLATPSSSSLPTSASRFVGRGMELAKTGTLLATCRLLTLTGPGGSGKSRLAVELARAAAASHPDGVRLIDLAPLTPSASVSRELAAALGVRERRGEPLPRLLAAWLQHRRCLLVLDNCEHLVAACADLCSVLLEAAPGLRVLATSREPLAISGEVVFAVAGLRIARAGDPDEAIESADAVRLFIDRAAAARPGFALGPGDAARAAAVCARLDGLPLAIELAAARLRNISLGELAAWLEQRLDGLGESRAVHARHRTMRAAIEWSHDLLDDSEQAVFRRLSVFAGGLDSDAARAAVEGWEPLAGDVDILELCDRLANKSMLVAEPGPERTRYRMLEVVRQFAAGRLVEAGEEAAARSRHAAWYRDLIPDARTWSGGDQAMWVERLGREVANVRAALAWYLGDGWEPFLALDMVGRLWWFWYMRGLLGEGRGWFRRALAATPAEPSAERGLALRGAAATARVMGDFVEATQLGTESLDVCRALGDDRGIAASLNTLCISAMVSADLTAARRYGEESLEVAERLGDARGLANSRNSLGIVARNLGELDRAAELFASARDLYGANGNGRGVAAALSNLAILGRRTGDLQRARDLSLEALHLYTDLDFDEGRLDCLEMLGVLEADAGRAEPALRMLSVAARRLEELAAPLFVPDEVQQFADATALARTALGPAEAERIQRESQQLTIDDVVAELLRPATSAVDVR